MLGFVLRKISIVWIIYIACVIIVCSIMGVTAVIGKFTDVTTDDFIKIRYRITDPSTYLLIERFDSVMDGDYWFTHKILDNGSDTLEIRNSQNTDFREFYIPTPKYYPFIKKYRLEIENNGILVVGNYRELTDIDIKMIEKYALMGNCEYEYMSCRNFISYLFYLFSSGILESIKITVYLSIFVAFFSLIEHRIRSSSYRRREFFRKYKEENKVS